MKQIVQYEKQLVEDLCQLIAIPTVNNDRIETGAPFGTAIAEGFDWVKKKAEELGFSVTNFDGYALQIDIGSGADIIGMLCHVDVVPAGDGWATDPFKGEIINGKVYGRGTVDDKGPLICCLYAAKFLCDHHLLSEDKRIRIIVGGDEEISWRCINYYKEKAEAPRISFAADGMFPLVFGEKGLVAFDMEKSFSWEGDHKIRLLELNGGTARNSVPSKAGFRLKADENRGEVYRRLNDVASDNNIKLDLMEEGDMIIGTVQGKSAHAMFPERGVNAICQVMRLLESFGNDIDLSQFISLFEQYIGDDYTGQSFGGHCSDEESGALTFNVGKIDLSNKKLTIEADIRYPVSKNYNDIYESLEYLTDNSLVKCNKRMKGENMKHKLFVLLLCIIMILVSISVCFAEEQTSINNWTLSNAKITHKTVEFELSNVEHAQKATAILKNGSSDEISMNFNITSGTQKFSLTLPNDKYLTKDKEYDLYVKDAEGKETIHKTVSLRSCLSTYISGSAYPKEFVSTYSDQSNNISNISITANFTEYKGEIDDDGIIHVSYPKQDVGAIVQLKWSDNYGCEESGNYTIVNQKVSTPTPKVWTNGITSYQYGLDKNERMCATVNGITYYSEYGGVNKDRYNTLITYPQVPLGTSVEIWTESKNGSSSSKKIYECIECDLSSCTLYNHGTYGYASPTTFRGKITENDYHQNVSSVYIILNGKKYSAKVGADNCFELNYPYQNNTSKLAFTFADEHGCECKKNVNIYNTLTNYDDYVKASIVLANNTICEVKNRNQNVRICAKIGEKTYYGKFNSISVVYPAQKIGTSIKLWLEYKDGSKTSIIDKKVVAKKSNIIVSQARTNKLSGYLEGINENYIYMTEYKAASGYAIVNGKRYALSVNPNGKFSVNYNQAKVGNVVNLYVTDVDGYTYSKSVTLKNIAPSISVKSIDTYGDYLNGKTTPGASVTIKVGKTTIRKTANSKGDFSAKVKKHKAGTKIYITVNTKDGYLGKKTISVQSVDGTISIKKTVYRTSKKIYLSTSNAKKGDRIKITIGKKKYTKKVNSNKYRQTISIKCKKAKAGTKITVKLYDNFGKRKDTDKDIVYYGNKIYVGMSARNAQLTTWGKPKKNYYGNGVVQWCYYRGSKALYAYISNNKVRKIQILNY